MRKNTKGDKAHARFKRFAAVALVCMMLFSALPALAYENGGQAEQAAGQQLEEGREQALQLPDQENEEEALLAVETEPEALKEEPEEPGQADAEPEPEPEPEPPLPLEVVEEPVTQMANGRESIQAQADGLQEPPMQAAGVDIGKSTYSFTWLEETVQAVKGVTLDGDSLLLNMVYSETTSPATAIDNAMRTLTTELRFSVSCEEDIPAGGIEIRIPAYIFANDDGEPVGSFELWLATVDEADKGGKSYHYWVDNESAEIVITNHTVVQDSNLIVVPIAYTVDTRKVPHGYTNTFHANFSITVDGVKQALSSDDIDLTVEHALSLDKISKTASEQYYAWQSSWGSQPTDFDTADYYYVIWRVILSVQNSRDVTISLKEILDGGEVQGEFVGTSGITSSASSSPSFTRRNIDELTYSKLAHRRYQYIYVLTRYAKDEMPSGTTVENTVEATVLEKGVPGRTTDSLSSTREHVFTYDDGYTGDVYSLNKASTGSSGSQGQINALLLGNSMNYKYVLTGSATLHGANQGGSQETVFEIKDDNVELSNTNTSADALRLGENDYEFTEILFTTFKEYGYTHDAGGYTEALDTNYTGYQPIKIEYQKIVDGEWFEAGTVQRTGSGSAAYLYTNVEGEAFAGNTFALPAGAVGVRLLHSSTQYKVEIKVTLTVKLHPTDTVKAILKEVPQDKYALLYNYATLKYSEDMEYVRPDSSSHSLRWMNVSSQISGTTASITNHNITSNDGYTLVSNRGEMYTLLQGDKSFDVVELYGEGEQRKGTYYALLPQGAVLDAASMQAYRFESYGVTKTPVPFTLEQVDNWQGSGQTMVMVHMTTEDTENWYKGGGSAYSGFTVTYDYYYSFDSADLYGVQLQHDIAYRSASGTLAWGGEAAGGTLYQPQYFEALNAAGIKDDTEKDTIYNRYVGSVKLLKAMEYGFSKRVKAGDGIAYLPADEVAAGNSYTYRLAFKTEEDSTATDVVLYDVLEDGGAWQGELLGLDITGPVSRGIAVKVYYSTQTGLDLTNPANADLGNTAVWSQSAPASLADVTAIAIDLSTGADGSPYVFESNESVAVYMSMRAPDNYEDYGENDFAVNKAYIQLTTTLIGGSSKTDFQESIPTEMALRAPDVLVEKAAEPASGSESEPTLVGRGTEYSYTVSVTNTNVAEAMEGIVIEDALPVGLAAGLPGIEYYFGNAAPQPVLDAARVGASAAGQKLTFTVDKLAAGERVSFVIPVTVTGAVGTLLENTAVVTEFNGKSWELESETTYHVIDKEPATKQLVKVDDKQADRWTTVKPGDILTYRIGYSAPKDATGVSITDYLPDGTVFHDASPKGEPGADGRSYAWTIDMDGSNYAGYVEIQVKVVEIPDGITEIHNRARVSYLGGDGSDPEEPETTTPLAPTKTIKDRTNLSGFEYGLVVVGDEITYRITYGVPQGAAQVIIRDTLPEGVRVESASPGGSEADGIFTWVIDVGSAEDTGYVDITVVVEAVTEDEDLVNTAKITYVDGEGDETDDPEEPEVVIPGKRPKAPVVEKRVESSPVQAGGNATFTIKVTNPNEVVLKNITVTDLLPQELVYVDTDGSYDDTTHRVTWTIERLGAGETVSFYVTVTANTVGIYKNIAIAEAPGTEGGTGLEDIDPDNPDTSGPNVDEADVEFEPGFVKEISKQIFDGEGYVDKYTVKDPSEVLTYRVSVALPDDLAGYTSLRIEDLLPEELKLATGSPAADIRASVRGESTVLTGTAGYDDALRIAYYSLSDFTGLAGKTIDVEFDTKLADESYTGPIENTGRAIVNKEPGDVDYPDPGTDPENPDKETPGPDVDVEPKPEPEPRLEAPEVEKRVKESPVEVGKQATFTIKVRNPNDAALKDIAVTDLLPPGVVYVGSDGEYDAATHRVTWKVESLGGGESVELYVTVTADAEGGYKNIAIAEAPDTEGGTSLEDIDPDNPDTSWPNVDEADVEVEDGGEPGPDPRPEAPTKTALDVDGTPVDSDTCVKVGDRVNYRITYDVPQDAVSIRIEDRLPEGVKVAGSDPAGKRIENTYVWEIVVGSERDKGYVDIVLLVESIPSGSEGLVNSAKVTYVYEDGETPDPEEPEVKIPYEPEPDPSTSQPGGEDSTTSEPGGGDSTTSKPGGEDSTTSKPGGEDSTTSKPGGEDSTTSKPGGGDTTTSKPGGGEDSTTSKPGGGDSTTSKPGGGEDSTTSKPGGGDSTTSKPGGEDSTTSKPGGGDSTTSKPGGGEDSTTSKPGGEDSTTSKPGGGEDSTTSKPGGGDSTTSKPGGGDSTTSKPGGGGSTTSKPNGGGSTTSKPSTSGPSTSEQGGVSEPDPGPGPGPEPTTSRTTSRPVVVTPTTSRTGSTSASSNPASSSSRPGSSSSGSTGSSSSSGSGSSSVPDGSELNGGGDSNGPDGDGSSPNGGDPGSRGGLFSAGGGLGDSPTVQELIDETGSIDLFGNQTPLGSFALRGGWSLVSLLLSILSLLSAVVMFVRLLRNKKQKPEQEYDEDGEPIVQYNEDGEPEEEEQRYKTRRLRMFLATLSGLLPLLLFLILENLRSPMVLLTRWTPLIFVVTLLHFALVILQMVRRKVDEEDEEQDEDVAMV